MDIDETVATYGAAWNEPDAGKRAALLAQAWADDGTYTDPTAHAEGRDALVAHIGGFHEMMPGHTISSTSAVDAHGDVFRFAWEMRNGDGVSLEGMDFGEVAPDGRIRRIVGFFGPFPPLAG
jgi:hypothetical protein